MKQSQHAVPAVDDLVLRSNPPNRRIVLQSRPIGAPTAENFRMEELEVPVPKSGQILLRTLYLSLDPYMRGRMSDAASNAKPVAIGDVMEVGAVSRVEASEHPDSIGDVKLSPQT